MQFTQIPQNFAALDGEAVYAFTAETPGDYDICVFDAQTEALLGAKRFAEVTSARFDITPYLRPLLHYFPYTGKTGFVTDNLRTVSALVEINGIRTPARTFLPTDKASAAPSLLTTMPKNRLIFAGEGDELTFFAEEPCTVMLTAQYGETEKKTVFTSVTAGWQLFRLDTRDFPKAERIVVSADMGAEAEYVLATMPEGARRLAWRSSAGSVEHYTFPIEQTVTIVTEEQETGGSSRSGQFRGHTEKRIVLRSAYQLGETLETLSGILSAPAVWLVGENYTPVKVLTTTAEVRRHGALRYFEIEICMPICK